MSIVCERLACAGGIGAQLWRLSEVALACQETGLPPLLPDWPLAPFFSVPERAEGPQMVEGPEMSWSRSPAAAQEAEMTLREWLAPSELAVDLLLRTHGQALLCPNRAAVHLSPGARIDPEWLTRAMDLIEAEEAVDLLDGRDYATPLPTFVPLPASGDPVADFWLARECHRHVVTSAFSWWAAWLSVDQAPVALPGLPLAEGWRTQL